MKMFVGCLLALALTACATCKSSDTLEQCRTKERNNGQTRPFAASAVVDTSADGT
jgi:hypothetical protein